ncbi:hypothetical protein AB1J05_01550 [Staphylococcus cohnii species complex 1658]|uniref:hypothetical protein n=1 Tax=Staphylococcus cohnii species complex 1658 TaxID=3239424 RepID=UPI0034D95DC3
MRLESEINKHIVHKLEQERDMYKRNWDKTLEQCKQYKAERDTCLEDIEKLRERNRELEHNNDELNELFNYQENKKREYREKIEKLERENAEQLALLKEFRKLIDYKLTLHQGSSMYREYRSKLDQLGVK